MSKLGNYFEVLRPFTLIYPAVAIFAAAAAAAGGLPPLITVLGMACASLLNGASNAINQYYDRRIDAVNKPGRVIPSGRMDGKQVLAYGYSLYALCALLSALVNMEFLLMVIIASIATITYSAPPLRTRNHCFIGNIWVAVPRGLLIFVAGWSIAGSIYEITPWLIGSIMGLYLVGAASTKDFSDMKGDKMYGAKTLPNVYGVRKAARIMTYFLVLPFLLVIAYVGTGLLSPLFIILTLFALWGWHTSRIILENPDTLATERNHPSWMHMYLMMMGYTLTAAGIAIV